MVKLEWSRVVVAMPRWCRDHALRFVQRCDREIVVKMTTVRRWTGAETKALRVAMRLSIRDFAAHLDVGVRTVARWEARGSGITLMPDSQGLLDTALARVSDDVKQRFSTATASEAGAASGPSGRDVLHLPGIVSGQLVLVPLDATTMTACGLGVTIWTALNPDELQHTAAALEDPHANLDSAVVGYFNRQLGACMTDDGTFGPTKTLPAVLGLLAAIEHSAGDVRADVRRQLVAVGARGAEFAGWLYRDIHDPTHANFWYHRATEWAQEARDLPMVGYVLLRRSQMAYDDRDGVRVLTLAQAAGDGPWQLPIRVHAEVTQQEARGLAMTGEPLRLVEQKLEDARRMLADAAESGPMGELGASYNEGTLTLRAASCYVEAGRPRQAATLYNEVLEAGSLSRRDRGYFMARMASSLALAGEPDEAAGVGLRAAELATATTSKRTKRELGRTLTSLRPWIGRPGPRDLRDALSS